MYQSKILFCFLIWAFIKFVFAIPIQETNLSTISKFNDLSTATNLDQQKPDIGETVSKILRLMHSLSDKNILIPNPNDGLNTNSNFDLNEVKSIDRLKSFDDQKENDNKLTIDKNLNKQLNLQNNENIMSAKYPTDYFEENSKNIETNSRLSEIIPNRDDEIIKSVTNSNYIKSFANMNDAIDEDNKNKLIEKNKNSDIKKNLYDMVEDEEEDVDDEDFHYNKHGHNYNISLLSDRELNRTLFDIQWLLNQTLTKQQMESKFTFKNRNNRNKIAQRMEYFQKLYTNNHHLSSIIQTNQKRGEGPQLSVVSPLDILRDKLILEIARRKIEQSKSQMKENEDFLKKLG